MLSLLLTMWLLPAQAGWDLNKGASSWTWSVAWQDHQRKARKVNFSLPAHQIEADLMRPVNPPMDGGNDAAVKAINRWKEDDRAGVKVTAQRTPQGFKLSATGPRSALKKWLKRAGDKGETARDQWLVSHGFVHLRDGFAPNHAGRVKLYADELRPLAHKLQQMSRSKREYIGLALSLAQSLKYESRLWKGGDPGFRPPIAMLARRRGDCDSKTVLFLALVRAAYPKMPLAVVYTPGHALAGVGIASERGEKTFGFDGTKWVVAEPVGPALAPLGSKGKQSKLGRREVVRVPTL